jgi:hypothetical protein
MGGKSPEGLDCREVSPDHLDYPDCAAISFQPHAEACVRQAWDARTRRLGALGFSKGCHVVAVKEAMQILMQVGLGCEGSVNSGRYAFGITEPHLDIGQ